MPILRWSEHDGLVHVPPSEMGAVEHDVLSTVRAQLAPYGPDAAEVGVVWSDGAGMWFVEITPTNTTAAPVSIGIDGDELLLNFGKTRLEMWQGDPTPVERLKRYLRAIFAGEFEEAGWGSDRFAKLRLDGDETFACGSVHFPVPWAWRRKTRYDSY